METIEVRLKPGREKSVVHGHPWIFSGSIESVKGADVPYGIAEVLATDGRWLARGLWNKSASLCVRIYTQDPAVGIDADLFRARIQSAVALRHACAQAGRIGKDTDSWRVVFSESDGISGLIVDKYADSLSVQVNSLALCQFLEPIFESLIQETGAKQLRVSADVESVEREGIDPVGVARYSNMQRNSVHIRQDGLTFDVDMKDGQKTGFYLDQRENRRRVTTYAKGRNVLSCYCYTGAFEVYAAAAGASAILGIDSSDVALQQALKHHDLNHSTVPVEYERADVPMALRKLRDVGKTFDLIILDPPRFVFNREQKESGMRGYKDINLLALKLLAPGGVLATFSCSGMVSGEDFRTVLRWAATDSKRNVRIVETLGQPFDHPIAAGFSEGEYLKGLICMVE